MKNIYLFGRFRGTKHPDEGTVAEMGDYKG